MKKNVGNIDKAVRIILAVVLYYFAYNGDVGSPWNYVLYVVGVVLLLTALLGTCPIFSAMGISTNKKE